MNNDIENAVREAFEAAVPDMKDAILSDLRATKKGKVLKMPNDKPKTNKRWLRLAAVAAALILTAGAAFAVGRLIPGRASAVTASVMIDVNPSIELKVDSGDKVVSAEPRNDDGAAVLDGMELKGSDVRVAVNAIIGSMVRGGYLNELANSILITVESRDAEAELRLRDSLGADVSGVMDSNPFGYAVMSQTLEPDPDTEALAEAYGVTRSKAQLIRKLIRANRAYSFSDLAALSINELGLLSGQNAVEDLRSYGASSDRAYIGEQEAIRIALGHAGVSQEQASNMEAELDCDHGRMVYEVEFDANGLEYDYDIDAVTGQVIKAESEPADHAEPPVQPTAAPTAALGQTEAPAPTEAPIPQDRALEIALEHAGISRSEAKNIEIELERDDGRLIYDVEFRAGGRKYEYEIDAYTGSILEADSEAVGSASTPKPTKKPSEPTPKPSQNIGGQAALTIALSDAGVSAGNASNVEVELKTKSGVRVYEVEFHSGGYEYEYVINAKTGEIIERSREKEDHQGAQGSLIGEERAWQIALSRAGLTMAQISDKQIELDRDNGVTVYEIEFKAKGYEYEIEINAVTGAVLKFEKERDD